VNGMAKKGTIMFEVEDALGLRGKTKQKTAVRKLRKRGKLPQVIKVSKNRTGSFGSIKADRKRKAMKPGLRLSKSGKTYFENRRNRSDLKRI